MTAKRGGVLGDGDTSIQLIIRKSRIGLLWRQPLIEDGVIALPISNLSHLKTEL